ncbi:MAG: hypothetical protein GY853_12400 [PVC group bacterium]|nr:hypothetical protein [PVC group bacterium]
MNEFLLVLKHYIIEILPALGIGFLLSGLIHELVPDNWIEKHLGKKGIIPIVYATIAGTILPICCIGSLPVALSFYKKGSKLGPVLAFLVATPATSISALLVTYRLLGLKFTLFIFFAVIAMGILMGIIGNRLSFTPRKTKEEVCSHCQSGTEHTHDKTFRGHIKAILKFSFWDMPKEIGLELIVGIILAAVVATFAPIGIWIKNNLGGLFGYVFALVFGIVMYICSTATVPLVDAFVQQGLNVGAGMVLLIAGPITSYATILVLKKEFGAKILSIYLLFISVMSLLSGYLFSLL